MGQDSEMEQSSYLTPDTNSTRKGKRLKKDEKTLLKKKVLGVKRNNKGTMEDGSSTDEGRDVDGLMKSM